MSTWRWVTNSDPKDIDAAVARAAEKYGGPARGGQSRWPHEPSVMDDPGEAKPGRHGQVGVYVDREAWVAWFRRVNPKTNPGLAPKFADEVINEPGDRNWP